jgi:Glycosyltransferase family 87
LAFSLHHLASALEETGGGRFGWRQPSGGRRWFLLRLLPLWACLVPIAHTLMRSQANLFLLALFCGLMAGLIRGRRFQAGLCLAGAICLKIFPAFLLLIPLIRRDLRGLAGCATGLFVGLLLIPAAAVGPGQTVVWYRELGEVLVGPALGMGENKSRASELIDVTASDSQSFQALLHNTWYLNPVTRPREVDPLARKLHWLIGAGLTLATLLAGWRHRQARGPAMAIFVGALVLVMLLLSPVCHTHYFSMAVPVVMGLMALSWDRQAAAGADMASTRLNVGLMALIGVMYAGFIPPLLPPMQVLRDACWMTYAMLILWLTACVTLWRLPADAVPVSEKNADLATAA